MFINSATCFPIPFCVCPAAMQQLDQLDASSGKKATISIAFNRG
jgi:hypothetical protein